MKKLRQVKIRKDTLRMNVEWTIYKWGKIPEEVTAFLQNGGSIKEACEMLCLEVLPSTERMIHNVALNVGLQNLIDIICGIGTTTLYNNANARLCVGSDATAADPTQTDLIDATPTWKAMDATYPQKSGQTAEWRSTFGSDDANEAWQEYAVDNGATAHKLLNRKVESKGTKASGETWTLSLKITFS